jgi:hypothetical protein
VRAALALALLGGCDDAVLLTVDGDAEVGAICLAVADRDPAGGHFGRAYQLDELPQTLAVEPGAAAAAEAWVRGYRGGVEIARDRAEFLLGVVGTISIVG